MRCRRILVLAAATSTVAALAVAAPSVTTAASPNCFGRHAGDTNGDSIADPVIGVPGKDQVDLFKGTPHGITPTGSMSPGAGGLDGSPAARGSFGSSVAMGDVNGDSCADAVILNAAPASGENQLTVVYGDRGSGLTTEGAEQLNASSIGGTAEDPVLADFNGDGFADLAVISRQHQQASDTDVVTLTVVPGSPQGLEPGVTRAIAIPSKTLPISHRRSFNPSITMATGDANGDGRADLAVDIANSGVGGKSRRHVKHGDVDSHPVVDVVYGAKQGLGRGRATQQWDREHHGVPGADFPARLSAVAFGHFNPGLYDDLAIALPHERAIVVVYGGPHGLTAKRSDVIAPHHVPKPASEKQFAQFPVAATGNFNSRGPGDLVVGWMTDGVPRVLVFHGGKHGLTRHGQLTLTPHTKGIPRRHLGGRAAFNDFGSTLRVGYFGYGSGQDLLISDAGDEDAAGSVTELFGSRRHGLTTKHATRFTERTTGVPGTPTRFDDFGA